MECAAPALDGLDIAPAMPSVAPTGDAEAPPKSSTTTGYPTPVKAPIGLQMLQNKEGKDVPDSIQPPPQRTGSGGQIHRLSSASSNKDDAAATKARPKTVTSKYSLSKLPVSDVITELDLRWKRVKDKSDLTQGVEDDLEYFSACAKYANRSDRKILITRMHDGGLVEMMDNIWKQNFKLFCDGDDKVVKDTYDNMKFIMICSWNTTDQLPQTSDAILDTGFYKDLIQKYLNSPMLLPGEMKKTSKTSYLTKGLMGIIHNMLQHSDSRALLREIGAVNILSKYRESNNDFIKSKTEMLLAYLIDEKENDMLNSDDKTFSYLISVLKDCLKTGKTSEDHYSKRYGYSATEVLSALNQLSVNDSNKQKIVDNGALPIAMELMKPETSTPSEQTNAAKLIWNLSFLASTKEAIQNQPGCVEGLQNMLTGRAAPEAKRTAFGALWALKVKPKKKESEIIEEQKASESSTIGLLNPIVPERPIDKDAPHIFISYNWGSKPTMLSVRDKLKTLGYNVWMDIDDMSGSILEAMAMAVEHAAVVVVAMSSKYKESPNCRTEGEYAFKQRKTIVPLRLEVKYLPDGWLGALVGNSLFFDFSSPDKLKLNFDNFVRELGDRGKLSTNGGAVINPSVSHDLTSMPPTKPAQKPSSGTEKWSSKDVQKWLDKITLTRSQNKFSEFNGEMLLEYKCMMRDAPEFFYKTLKEDFNLSLPMILIFTRALKTLE